MIDTKMLIINMEMMNVLLLESESRLREECPPARGPTARGKQPSRHTALAKSCREDHKQYGCLPALGTFPNWVYFCAAEINRII